MLYWDLFIIFNIWSKTITIKLSTGHFRWNRRWILCFHKWSMQIKWTVFLYFQYTDIIVIIFNFIVKSIILSMEINGIFLFKFVNDWILIWFKCTNWSIRHLITGTYSVILRRKLALATGIKLLWWLLILIHHRVKFLKWTLIEYNVRLAYVWNVILFWLLERFLFLCDILGMLGSDIVKIWWRDIWRMLWLGKRYLIWLLNSIWLRVGIIL